MPTNPAWFGESARGKGPPLCFLYPGAWPWLNGTNRQKKPDVNTPAHRVRSAAGDNGDDVAKDGNKNQDSGGVLRG